MPREYVDPKVMMQSSKEHFTTTADGDNNGEEEEAAAAVVVVTGAGDGNSQEENSEAPKAVASAGVDEEEAGTAGGSLEDCSCAQAGPSLSSASISSIKLHPNVKLNIGFFISEILKLYLGLISVIGQRLKILSQKER